MRVDGEGEGGRVEGEIFDGQAISDSGERTIQVLGELLRRQSNRQRGITLPSQNRSFAVRDPSVN